MSLIQEALRRQQEEMQAEEKKRVGAQTSMSGSERSPDSDVPQTPPNPVPKNPHPAPLPSDIPTTEDTQPDPPKRRTSSEREHRVLGPLMGMLLVIVLLGGLVAWAALWGYRVLTASDAPPALDTVVTTVPEPAPDPVVEAPPSTLPEPEIAEVAVQETTEAPDEPVMVEVEITEPLTEDLVAQPVEPLIPEIPDATVALQDAPRTVVPPPPPPPPPPIIWPELHISGVMGSGESGSAIINGNVIGLHENIGDVTVRGFGRGFVVLEYQGETRRFSVGRSTR